MEYATEHGCDPIVLDECIVDLTEDDRIAHDCDWAYRDLQYLLD